MPVKYYACRVLLILWLAWCLQACTSNTPSQTNNTTTLQNEATTSALIERAKSLANTYNDSIPLIYKTLLERSRRHNDKVALVYGEKFECMYYWHSGSHQKAMEYGVKALSDAEKWKVYLAVPDIYLIIGNLNKEKKDYPMAFKDADLALKTARELKDTADIISALGDKAMFTRGWYIISNKSVAAADSVSLPMQLAALKMAQSNVKYERNSIKFYTNIAQAYKDQGDLEKTLLYADRAVELANKYHRQRSLTYAYCWMGEAWYRHGNDVKGLDYLNKAVNVSITIKEPFRTMEIYQTIYQCYFSSGDYKDALIYSDRNRRLNDSLQILTNQKQIADLQVKYESDKKDSQIAVLAAEGRNKSRQLLWIMLGSVVFSLLFAMVLYQYHTINRQNKQIMEKNDVLNAALSKIAFIQSHEMRKPLASILGLVNVIKADHYEIDEDCLNNLDKSAKDLDQKIRSIITETEVNVPLEPSNTAVI